MASPEQAPRRGAARGAERTSAMAQVVERNIRALLEKRKQEEQRLAWGDRLAERITRLSGSMSFVYVHGCIVATWLAVNLGWIPGVPTFDPTFVILAMAASVEAIFLSALILITQNRMMRAADRRADLSLQVSLLAEHEVTRLIQMTAQICDRLQIDQAGDPELVELSRDVHPEEVLDRIDLHENRAAAAERKPASGQS